MHGQRRLHPIEADEEMQTSCVKRPGPTQNVIKNNIVDTWNIFITGSMLEDIVHHTKQKAIALGLQIELNVEAVQQLS